MPRIGSNLVWGAASAHGCLLLIGATAVNLCAAVNSLAAPTTFVSGGAEWRYQADGSDQGTNWRKAGFDDLAWPSGPAPLGLGDDGLATVIAPVQAPITTYFRRAFLVEDRRVFTTLTVRMRRDDGLLVRINNQVVVHNNLPFTPVNYLTPATTSVSGDSEIRWVQFGTSPTALVNGTNVLTAELHQAPDGENDARFDLELIGNLPLGPPTVAITSHRDMDIVSPGPMIVRAEASDIDGQVSWVTFYTNGVRAFTDFAEPFEFTIADAAPGRYRLMAEALDYSGRRAETGIVRVQVGEVAGDRLLRGPYLQSCSSTSVVVRWRTDWFTQGWVTYGTGPDDHEWAAQNAGLTTEHTVQLTGLRPHTKYYYAIGTAKQVLAGGGDYFFTTAPTNAQRTRIWAIGDAGTAGIFQAMVRDAFHEYAGTGLANVWLMLGDNAYECGTDGEYQAAVFNVYPEILRRVALWPTIGNHDAGCYSDPNQFPYLDIFHLPAQGEAGGVASGTEKYYSFDHGNIHFVCLDSQTSSRLSGGAMLTWLEQDLAATDKDWIIAYWHHPPYTFGTHNSDFEQDLIEMRQYVVPILESHGVDLVLCGHSHNYERSYLLNGHYGFSGDFSAANVLNDGFGRDDEDGAYQKPAGGIGANRGTVYTVCGCSGEGGYFEPRFHPAMRVSLTGFGSMILDVDGLRLDARFLTETGSIADYFTIRKGMSPDDMRPSLSLHRSGNRATITWPTSLRAFQLEAAERLGPEESWRAVAEIPLRHGRKQAVTVDLVRSNEVFRLKAEP